LFLQNIVFPKTDIFRKTAHFFRHFPKNNPIFPQSAVFFGAVFPKTPLFFTPSARNHDFQKHAVFKVIQNIFQPTGASHPRTAASRPAAGAKLPGKNRRTGPVLFERRFRQAERRAVLGPSMPRREKVRKNEQFVAAIAFIL